MPAYFYQCQLSKIRTDLGPQIPFMLYSRSPPMRCQLSRYDLWSTNIKERTRIGGFGFPRWADCRWGALFIAYDMKLCSDTRKTNYKIFKFIVRFSRRVDLFLIMLQGNDMMWQVSGWSMGSFNTPIGPIWKFNEDIEKMIIICRYNCNVSFKMKNIFWILFGKYKIVHVINCCG